MSGSALVLDIALRAAEAADFPAIQRLHALSFATLASGVHDAAQIAAHTELTESPEYETDVLRSHLMLALTPAGDIVATAGWIPVPDEPATARIRKVFVHPEWARRGLASRLVRDAEHRALEAGYPRMIVRANRNAVPLYRRLGYEPLREGVMAAPGGIDLPVVFMEKAATAGLR
ncbi:MAG TPA: GNAT family N-acetyltransferase [Stellaceae bacterium]|nr:GNAT family N-acetyltransferase [Stellaceae bacterium]